mgnify:CR=1 FL=1
MEDIQKNTDEAALFEWVAERIAKDRAENDYYGYAFKDSELEREIVTLENDVQVRLALELLKRSRYPEEREETHEIEEAGVQWNWATNSSLNKAAITILNKPLTFCLEQIIILVKLLSDSEISYGDLGGSQVLKALKSYLKNYSVTPDLKDAIVNFCQHLESGYYTSNQTRQQALKLKQLVSPQMMILPINVGEAWSDRAIADITALPEADRTIWSQILLHCTTANAAKPTPKWLTPVPAWVDHLGAETIVAFLKVWFSLVDQPRTQPIAEWSQWAPDPNQLIDDRNGDILKGLVWLCPVVLERCADRDLGDDMARVIARLTLSAYRKVAGVGPRCVRLGNAGVRALGGIPGMVAIGQLALLNAKVKLAMAQKGINQALNAAAIRAGLPRDEIEELGVPTYGLEAVGLRRETLGEFTAELVVTGTSSTVLRWLKPDGQPQKSVPKAVKDNFAEELKALKQAAKDIQKMLPVQRDRLEAVYLPRKTWDYGTWRDRYLDQPLIGTLARRLIWWFSHTDNAEDAGEVAGIWHQGQLVDVNDRPIDNLTNTTRVRLWHPLDESTDRVLAWRSWLLDRQISQPFKQAHREIYLLTPAEINTGVYSNRFAAHIIKQHQFNALCGQRGWKNTLRLMVDDCYPPASLWLDHWNLRAEFWIEGVGDDYGVDTTEAGSYLHLATDQVRFYPIKARQNYAYAGGGGYTQSKSDSEDSAPIALDRIPKLVFSEVMRDVDLFVGVASVGNDPAWSDGGREGRHIEYWQSYSFGELSATATTRRQLLETLIPRLKIRDRCSFTDRFLVVRGEIRTYKIHLGSGNILMEPNDEYLCIVPNSRQDAGTNGVFLPFEGDRILSIILSKAFLLAEDTAISDRTILQQIQPSEAQCNS